VSDSQPREPVQSAIASCSSSGKVFSWAIACSSNLVM
jgi:hypothetical protein